ncbi:MAG TPA: S41 family peptidase [Opitutaceae bacterium]|nr:S41 family peptidase [Opitutaceae bacterium]
MTTCPSRGSALPGRVPVAAPRPAQGPHRALRRRPRLLAGLLAAVLSVVALCATSGCATAPSAFRAPAPLSAAARPAHNLRVFDRAWRLVQAKYFDASFRGQDWRALREKYRPEAARAADDDALYGVLNRLLSELKESHLVALPPRQAHEFRTQHRAAVGMRWRVVEGRRVVTDVVPGSPAAQAGVQPGWLPVARDGIPLDQEAPFANEVGRTITYDFLDADDRPVSRSMTAALLSFERREARVLDDGIVLLRFDTFGARNARWFKAELKKHRAAPAVIVDLRQNPGGLAVALRLAVAEFFPGPVDSGTSVRRSGRRSAWNSLRLFPAKYPGRVVILLDRFSASSAEIFAHVLQHHDRATVVGRRSAGAVIVARFYRLPGGGRLEVPVEDYLGVDGQRIEGRGVAPDMPVELSLAALRAGRDPDVEVAVTHLRAQISDRDRK